MSEPSLPDRSAPEGTTCKQHPERPALALCPLCGHGACIVCWHEIFDRCDTCLRRDPASAAPPVPWDHRRGGLVARRWFETLVAALRPTTSAPAFAAPELWPALGFALLTALPLTLLRGILPFTQHLFFGAGLSITTKGAVSPAIITIDIVRAMGISLLVTTVAWLALTLPYVSLTRAYGSPLARNAALRVMLYRAWLLPMSSQWPTVPGLLLVASFALPASTPQGVMFVIGLADLLPLLLLLFSMRATARYAAGTGALASFMVTVLPFVLLFVAEGLTVQLLGPLIPAPVH